MKKQDLKSEQAADLFRKDLTPEEERKIIESLEEGGMTGQEIESLKEISSNLDKVFNSEPGKEMDSKFYSMLEDESKSFQKGDKYRLRDINKYSWMLAAAGIALFILGWFSASWIGNPAAGTRQLADLSVEVRDLKETLVLTMMNQTSAVERIKAVNMVSEFETTNTNIIENLFKALNTDNNDNVRLLALETLLKYSDNPDVRQGIVNSITMQTSPMIQLRLTEVMVALDEKRAADEFKKLLEDPSLNYTVRNKMQEAVGTLL